MSRELFIKKYKVPEAAKPYLSLIFTEQEMDFAEQMESDTFTAEQVAELAGSSAAETFYKRGIISFTDNSRTKYCLGDFYTRLDLFALGEQEVYRSIPKEGQQALDAWYLDAFQKRLDPDCSKRPTADEVVTLEETLEFIEQQGDKEVYLLDCDCKSLSGACNLPKHVCISYRTGVNLTTDRGIGEKIDKEKAKEVVRMADEAGLMHTINGEGICNCCGDCCYLFRTMKQRQSTGLWPKSNHRIAWEAETCVQCESCLERCHFQVLRMEEGEMQIAHEQCVGCGICVSACPVDALHLIPR
ncbi:MAG: ATP-binding protein [Lachnospiraceae bacterium]|jgi:Pyruvate/2-oxoacid:ferredoxin oxidoreductase delta subunit